MAFSIVEFLTKIVIGLFVGGLIAVPIVLIIWKLKTKKIKKNMPTNMKEQIEIFKNNERRAEDEKRNREQSREDRRNQRAVDAIKSNNGNSVKGITGRRVSGKDWEIPKTETNSVRRTKPNTKRNWPSFE